MEWLAQENLPSLGNLSFSIVDSIVKLCSQPLLLCIVPNLKFRTLAQTFDEQGKLGASFFFKRGEGDRGNVSRFFPTVVTQLVRHFPAMLPHTKEAINQDSTIASKTLKEQFEKLFLQPLTEVGKQTPQTLLIVIDALDECDSDGHVKLVLHLLGRLHVETNVHVKIFITSRPECAIRLGLSQMSKEARQDLIFPDIPISIVESDLIAYLASELEHVRQENQEHLPQHWPSSSSSRWLGCYPKEYFCE